MRIALCDRDDYYIKKLKNCLYRYSNLYKLEFLVDTFKSGEELLDSENNYYLVFMEYSLSGLNGLETAKQLKSKKRQTTIIFLTNKTEIVFKAYQVAYRFLTKPLCENLLFEALDEFFSSKNVIWVSNRADTFCLNTNDIIYLEANNKHCLIHLKNAVIPCNRTMARVFAVLPKTNFIKINRAFIINLNYICKYNKDCVFLNNGENLHVTRNYYKSFKEEYKGFANPNVP